MAQIYNDNISISDLLKIFKHKDVYKFKVDDNFDNVLQTYVTNIISKLSFNQHLQLFNIIPENRWLLEYTVTNDSFFFKKIIYKKYIHIIIHNNYIMFICNITNNNCINFDDIKNDDYITCHTLYFYNYSNLMSVNKIEYINYNNSILLNSYQTLYDILFTKSDAYKYSILHDVLKQI